MVNQLPTLPAVLIGGPPHAGKSALFYSLTHALRERGIRHHAIRACPDGEGNWTQESDEKTVSQIRIKGDWSDDFVKRICSDLEHRCLPLLVDMGGYPKESQACILRQCTHSLLLLRDDRDDYTQLWLRLIEESGLSLLAQIDSQLEGTSTITSQTPILKGTLISLVRNDTTAAKGPLFDALVERIATLFNSSFPRELKNVFFEKAPTKLVIDLDEALAAIAPSTTRWEPEMLAQLLTRIPEHTPMSVYGVGPHWLYAALLVYADQQPFYQFNPRQQLGWMQPVPLKISNAQFSEIVVQSHTYLDLTVLSINILPKHLEYFHPEPLPFPPVRTDIGLIIDGSMPAWLLTALVRLYKELGVAWIAAFYPPKNKAIVVYSRVEKYNPGDAVPNPSV